MGIGRGTLAICAFGVVGLVICFFKDCTATPSLMVAAGIILPLIILFVVWVLPKQSLQTDQEQADKQPTDSFRLRTGIFSALIFSVCICICCVMCCSRVVIQLTGQRVDSNLSQFKRYQRPVIELA